MKKKLVMKFVKLDCALVAQQISIYGNEYFDEKTEHTKMGRYIHMDENSISLLPFKCGSTNTANIIYFDSDTECDKYLEKVVKWISKEQFATGGKLKVGEMCEVSEDGKNWNWGEKRLFAVLPENFRDRYIVWSEIGKDLNGKDPWCSWAYARPIASCVQPKIDGDVYTWEMEVANER